MTIKALDATCENSLPRLANSALENLKTLSLIRKKGDREVNQIRAKKAVVEKISTIQVTILEVFSSTPQLKVSQR